MGKHGTKMRKHLRECALELYGCRGYEQTTTAQIAARAGVTERTFFRYFADKREVLFEEEALRNTLLDSMATAPATLAPLEALIWAFGLTEPLLEEHRSSSELQLKIIAAAPALQERHLAKLASLTDHLASALRQRGIDDRQASLAAQVGMVAYGHAVGSWRGNPSSTLTAHLLNAFDALRILSSGPVDQDSAAAL